LEKLEVGREILGKNRCDIIIRMGQSRIESFGKIYTKKPATNTIDWEISYH